MRKAVMLISIQFLFVQVTFGQQVQRNKQKVVEIAPENGVIMTIFQPDCPLRIENVEFFVTEDGERPVLRYELKNTSPKAIRYFSVGFNKKHSISQWGKYGIAGEDGVGIENGTGPNLLMQGDTFENFGRDEFIIVPMTKDVRILFADKQVSKSIVV